MAKTRPWRYSARRKTLRIMDCILAVVFLTIVIGITKIFPHDFLGISFAYLLIGTIFGIYISVRQNLTDEIMTGLFDDYKLHRSEKKKPIHGSMDFKTPINWQRSSDISLKVKLHKNDE